MSTEISTKFKSTEIGLIPHEWSICKLQENILIKGRIGWKGLKKSEYLDEGFAIINGLQFDNDEIDWKTVGRISKERYDESPEIMLKDGDILMTKDGTIGKLAYINKLPEPATVASGVFVIRNNKNSILDQDFLFHYFHSDYFKNLVYSRIEGAVIPHLYQRDINELFVPVPPLHEQKQIAEILSAIKDKIKLNRKININLEKIAIYLFKEWFVDVSDNIKSQWKKRKLGEFFPIKTGKKDANVATEFGRYPFFSCSQNILRTKEYSFDSSSILLAGNGDFNVKWYEGKFEAYQRTYVLTPHKKELLGFLYYLIKYFLDDITAGHRGSVISFITKGMIENFEIMIPDDEELSKKAKTFYEINQMIDGNNKENEYLSRSRDSLLPRLMTGRIRVK